MLFFFIPFSCVCPQGSSHCLSSTMVNLSIWVSFIGVGALICGFKGKPKEHPNFRGPPKTKHQTFGGPPKTKHTIVWCLQSHKYAWECRLCPFSSRQNSAGWGRNPCDTISGFPFLLLFKVTQEIPSSQKLPSRFRAVPPIFGTIPSFKQTTPGAAQSSCSVAHLCQPLLLPILTKDISSRSFDQWPSCCRWKNWI